MAGELDADELGELKLPWHSGHDVHRVGTAHSDGYHAEPACVHGVGIRPDHKSAREGIILKHHLVYDAGTWLPKSDSVLIRYRSEKIKNLVGFINGLLKICSCAYAGLNEVVAVNRGGHRYFFAACRHELQQGHLGRSILHGNTIGRKINVGITSLKGFFRELLPEVSVQNFLAKSKGSP